MLELFQKFGMALAVGLLIGVEREREKSGSFAGIRTFPLIAMTGCMTAMIEGMSRPWLFAAGFLAVTALSFRGAHTEPHQGITTQVSALLAYLLGGLAWWDMGPFASAVAVVIVMLLSAKAPLEKLASQIGHKDIAAMVQFGIITLIILPIVPNQAYGPLDVLNPYKIWLMVVLISAINLIGYAVSKIVGPGRGIEMTGAVGGLISSTAVTLGLSRRSRAMKALPASFAVGILLASCIMFPRVLLIAFSINRDVAVHLLYPALAATSAGILGCAVLRKFNEKDRNINSSTELEPKNPLELLTAVKFGLLFGAILFLSKAANVHTGEAGIYLSSIIAGITSVDAATLSLADLAGEYLDNMTAARGIVLACASNTLVKAGIILLMASPAVGKRALPVFLLIGAAAVASVFLMG